MSEAPLLSLNCIQANPDIAGIGVRVAIYAQNFIALILAIVALGDRYVSWKELLLIGSQSMTILLTACALLLSALIQALTFGMSTYHTLIVLNLAWMNNTNTLLYAVLFRYQGLVQIPGFKLSFAPQTFKSLPRRKAIPLLTLGALHLSFVAALGFWFWLKVDTFGANSQCTPRPPLFLVILSHRISIDSRALRIISLAIYGVCAIPGINLMIVGGAVYGPSALCSWLLEKLLPIPKNVAFFLPGYVTLAVLIGINVVIAIDTETMVHQTKQFVQPGESQWTFGQTLAILMLVLPLKDIALSCLGEDKDVSKTRERIDEERAVYRRNWRKWAKFVPTRDWPNVNWPNAPLTVRAPRPITAYSSTETASRSLSSSSFTDLRHGPPTSWYSRRGDLESQQAPIGKLQQPLPVTNYNAIGYSPSYYPADFRIEPSFVYDPHTFRYLS
ncbi:hypothetical protein D9756_003347 [Leucocoprinus leucothites]|uniref:Uncharacterized protein n=1 Tax=Leucocoprinus leucothites TaxID=201217 RepID=A0A8H5G7A9_9AGAR|nr:hypothetical protein D9756_003347 [Leucoagaricus leucothites]